MTRRAALATAGAITIVLLAAAAAIATNLGVLRVATDTGSAGGLSATELAPVVSAQQPAGDPGAARTDNPNGAQAREPEDGAGEDRSGLGASDDHLSPAGKARDERYEGRNDDD
jgi:hypothetical protein